MFSTSQSTSNPIQKTATAINTALAKRGGFYASYSSKLVSWDDVSRGTIGSSLSCWGSNITDTYLKTKEGDSLFTVRPDNWNEKLGVVRASDVALLTGNCDVGGRSVDLRPVTLESFLKTPALLGAAYSGISPSSSLARPDLDDKISIRFQTVFIPLPEAAEPGVERARVQFAAEAYNYNTHSDDDPRNMIILASSQGLAIQTDGRGAKQLFHHGRDSSEGPAKKYWLEAEASNHAVGAAQNETAEERADALRRGKATSETIGIRAMGSRFNALLTVQVPLKQRTVSSVGGVGFGGSGSELFAAASNVCAPSSFSVAPSGLLFSSACAQTMPMTFGNSESPLSFGRNPTDPPMLNVSRKKAGRGTSIVEGRGINRVRRSRTAFTAAVASAARVSRGDISGPVKSLMVSDPKRHDDEHITVTVVMYNTVAGGVPSERDVAAAIEDLEKLYAACSETGRLADAAFEFVTKPLTIKDCLEIFRKVSTPSTAVSE